MTKKLELILALALSLNLYSPRSLAFNNKNKYPCDDKHFVYKSEDGKTIKKHLETGDSFLVSDNGSLFYCPTQTRKCYLVKCGPKDLMYLRRGKRQSIHQYDPDIVPYYKLLIPHKF
ncbi:hypothetical protein J4216_00090 [Candidatus Woesearchaeota archaeon]|nr:hypothetical protein [Candidatus Woesearchaeota archaeon]